MRVRAKTKVFVDNVLRQEGDEFEYNGPENHNLEPLEKPRHHEESRSAPKKDDPDDYPQKKK